MGGLHSGVWGVGYSTDRLRGLVRSFHACAFEGEDLTISLMVCAAYTHACHAHQSLYGDNSRPLHTFVAYLSEKITRDLLGLEMSEKVCM
jgi:hypothetical protein